MIKNARKVRVIAGFFLSLTGALAHAGELTEPKKNPFDNTPSKQMTDSRSLDEAAIQNLIQQRLDVMMMEMGGGFGSAGAIPGPGDGIYISSSEILNSLVYLGVVNGQHVYKDIVQGCYIYESIPSDANSGTVDESRCYDGVYDRLRRDIAQANAADRDGTGNTENKR